MKILIRTALAVCAAAIVVTVAVAQQDPIAARKALMKQQGAATGQGAKFMKGEEPFDLAKAQALLATLASTAEKIPDLFPDNSKTGGETAALPAIWEKMADFKASAAKLAADAKAAQASVKDEASFKAAFPGIGKDCGGCHEVFRAKKS